MIKYREYDTYDDYLEHQSSKLKRDLEKRRGKVTQRVGSFYYRFHYIKEFVKGPRVLCLGARLGEEVRAFIMHGFKNTLGVDLNPGGGNKYVFKGDFHNLDKPDNHYDTLYSNSFDHVHSYSRVNDEMARIIKPDGRLILDFSHVGKDVDLGHDGVWEANSFDTLDDIESELKDFELIVSFDNPANTNYTTTIWDAK